MAMENMRQLSFFNVCFLLTVFSVCGRVVVVTAGCGSTPTGEPVVVSMTDCLLTPDNERGCATSSLNATGAATTCDDLQSAIDWTENVAANLSLTSQCIEISLPNGEHTISRQIDLQNASVHLIGCGDHVTVKCSYFADPNLNGSREIHTWYFDRSESVAFENIHFESCGFPFRLDTVRSVLVSNCSFR